MPAPRSSSYIAVKGDYGYLYGGFHLLNGSSFSDMWRINISQFSYKGMFCTINEVITHRVRTC